MEIDSFTTIPIGQLFEHPEVVALLESGKVDNYITSWMNDHNPDAQASPLIRRLFDCGIMTNYVKDAALVHLFNSIVSLASEDAENGPECSAMAEALHDGEFGQKLREIAQIKGFRAALSTLNRIDREEVGEILSSFLNQLKAVCCACLAAGHRKNLLISQVIRVLLAAFLFTGYTILKPYRPSMNPVLSPMLDILREMERGSLRPPVASEHDAHSAEAVAASGCDAMLATVDNEAVAGVSECYAVSAYPGLPIHDCVYDGLPRATACVQALFSASALFACSRCMMDCVGSAAVFCAVAGVAYWGELSTLKTGGAAMVNAAKRGCEACLGEGAVMMVQYARKR